MSVNLSTRLTKAQIENLESGYCLIYEAGCGQGNRVVAEVKSLSAGDESTRVEIVEVITAGPDAAVYERERFRADNGDLRIEPI